MGQPVVWARPVSALPGSRHLVLGGSAWRRGDAENGRQAAGESRFRARTPDRGGSDVDRCADRRRKLAQEPIVQLGIRPGFVNLAPLSSAETSRLVQGGKSAVSKQSMTDHLELVPTRILSADGAIHHSGVSHRLELSHLSLPLACGLVTNAGVGCFRTVGSVISRKGSLDDMPDDLLCHGVAQGCSSSTNASK